VGLPVEVRTMVQRRTDPGTAAQASKYLGIGMTSSLSTLLFLFLGSAADRWLGTGPWLTLAGAFVGAAAGFYYMYHHLVVVPRERKAREEKADR
jgi:F0F1-type ATP synthase assembly protein I